MTDITNWPQAFTIVGIAVCVAVVLVFFIIGCLFDQ